MRSYTHLTIDERERLRVGIALGESIRTIAAVLGRSPSSISREINRNRNYTASAVYTAYGAYCKYRHRRKRCQRHANWGTYGLFEQYLYAKLKKHWSPQAIVERYRLEHPQEAVPSYQSIYYGIIHGLLPKEYGTLLKRKGRRRNAYRTPQNGKLQVGRRIQERPEIANKRARLGDFESDTLSGKQRGASLATHVDRRSRYLIVAKLSNRSANEYLEKSIAAFERYGKINLHTMTVDRGMEFSCYRELEKRLGIKVYFADPCAPWQRGTNENSNGLLRQYIPKSTDISLLSEKTIQAIVDELNNRPRKVLGWLSPAEVFFNQRCCT